MERYGFRAEVPLTEIAVEAFRNQFAISGPRQYLFPSDENADGYQKTFKAAWHATLRRAGVRYFRIYDLRSTYAPRLSAGAQLRQRTSEDDGQGIDQLVSNHREVGRGGAI